MKIKPLKTIALFFLLAIGLTNCKNREVRETNNPLTNTPLEKYEVTETDNGSFLKDGYYKRWHMNGQIQLECNYKLNKLDGSYKEYFDNGQIEFDKNYKEDTADGHLIRYYKNGQKVWEGDYSSGKEIGDWNNWHENGQLKKLQKYNDKGQEDGEQKYWYSNGQLLFTGKSVAGERVGTWNQFDEDGELKRIYKYVNGKDNTFVGKWEINDGSIIEYLPDNTYLHVDKEGQKTKGTYKINELKLDLSNGYTYGIDKLLENEYKVTTIGYFYSGAKSYTAKRL
jgi:antitoxin component YwqK of YwqJK toxin-antitoxin module